MSSVLSHPVFPYVIGGGLAVAMLYVGAKVVMLRRFLPKRDPNRVYPHDTVILHQIGRGPYAPSMSPFPLKLETYLRMAKIPYQTDHDQGFSSKQKTPWMMYNDMEMGDSQLCIEYLNKTLGVDVNSHLTDEQKATARAFQKMVDENTYWCFVLHRCSFSVDYDFMKMAFGNRIPGWILKHICKKFRQQGHGQGMGRHTESEIDQILTDDLQALSTFLGTKAFMFGDAPSEVDCSVFGELAQMHWQSGSRLKEIVGKFPNLVAYCERMKTTFWPDWEECITHGGTRQATK